MRAGTLVPATLPEPPLQQQRQPRSMRAGTLVPATPAYAQHLHPAVVALNEGRNFSSGNTSWRGFAGFR